MNPQTTAIGQQSNSTDFFDPTKDIDLSHIEDQIIDTSKGNTIDFSSVAYNQVYSFRCLNCGFKYEGANLLETCPRCGSEKIDDSQ
jgi:predicted Zn-ribbon and HTH transcriptional regulator